MLEVSSLTAGYGDVIGVADLSLRVQPGEVVALLGANGAGKTTTLNAICGVIKPKSGRIVLDGEDVTGADPREIGNRGCTLVPEGRGLFPSMSVEDHLRLGGFLRHQREIDGAIEEVYERYFPKLRERRGQLAGTLSGGEQQMVALARGLMANPRTLMVDELSLGLAPIVIDQLYRHVAAVARERSLALLVVEQHAPVAMKYADRIYVLEAGRLRLERAVEELHGTEDIERAYLGLSDDEPTTDGAHVSTASRKSASGAPSSAARRKRPLRSTPVATPARTQPRKRRSYD